MGWGVEGLGMFLREILVTKGLPIKNNLVAQNAPPMAYNYYLKSKSYGNFV